MKYFLVIVCLALFVGCGGDSEKQKTDADKNASLQEMRILPEIINKPAFAVVGIKYRGSNQYGEIAGLWDQFLPRMAEIKNAVRDGAAYGVMDNYEKPPDSIAGGDTLMGEFDYLAGIEVTGSEDIPEGMEYWEIPEQTYAVFTFPFSKLIEVYNYALKIWLPKSGYEYTDGPEFEYYPPDFGRVEDSEMKYYIPVRKK